MSYLLNNKDVWVFSDPHYNHTNICGPTISKWKSGYRDYDNLYLMNNDIINSINDRVEKNHVLICAGDWAFGGHKNIEVFRNKLNVDNIILIYGNHDKNIRRDINYQKLFSNTYDMLEFSHSNHLFIITHYAMRVWNKSHHGSIHLYGHSHHTLPEFGKSMDVGWCKYRRPLHISEIIKIMSEREINFVDHHNPSTTE